MWGITGPSSFLSPSQAFYESANLKVKDSPERRMQNQLEAMAMQERYTGFMPNQQVFEDDLRASLAGIGAQLPYAQEAFNADLASRGLYSAGEAPKYMYKDVVAPITREMTSAVTRSKLAYAQQFQQGRMAEEQMRQNYMQSWVNWLVANKQIEAQIKMAKMQSSGNALGGLFSAAGQLGAAFILA